MTLTFKTEPQVDTIKIMDQSCLDPVRCLCVGILFLSLPGVFFTTSLTVHAEESKTVHLAYLKKAGEQLPKLSNLDLPPEDDGVAGGEQGTVDSNGTGKFMGLHFVYEHVIVPHKGDLLAAFQTLYAKGFRNFAIDASATELLRLADSKEGKSAGFFNVGSGDDLLRTRDCRGNVLHITPSDAMRADGLAQYLVTKRWRKWFLVTGTRERDQKMASAFRRSAKKFGAKVVAEKTWDFGPDMRRTAASSVPVFTQVEEYDVLVVADVLGEFGEYLMYRTWTPEVVVGTQGLFPVTWHRTHERWGAAQIQSRFLKNYGKRMSEMDYKVWLTTRSVSEAAIRTLSNEQDTLWKYLRGERFELAGYKGEKMTFRTWNGQLRQPILLASPTSLVSVSPQRQFLHEHSFLDTLGFDRSETGCQAGKQQQENLK